MPDLFSTLNAQAQPGATPTPAPTLESMGLSSYSPTIPGLFNTTDALSRLRDTSKYKTNKAAADVDYANQMESYNKKKMISELEAKLKEMGVTGEYTRKPKEVGYDFFDPEGRPISAYDYARAKGTSLSDALQESNNPGDQAALNDYKLLQSGLGLIQQRQAGGSMTEKEQEELDTFLNDNPEIEQSTPQDAINAFMDFYPHLFGRQGG